MMIRTKQFSFPRRQYFLILFRNSCLRNLWALLFFVVLAALAVYQFVTGSPQAWIYLAFVPLIPLYLAGRCWFHTTSKKHPLFFSDRFFEIDRQNIHCHFSNGTVNRIPLADITGVTKNRFFYLLFLSKRQFVFLPVSAFHTPGDITCFEGWLRGRKTGR